MREALLKTSLRLLFKPFISPRLSFEQQRRWISVLTKTNLQARHVEFEQTTLGGVATEIVTPSREEARGTLLFLHGGAYVLGSPHTHRSLTTHLAQLGGLRVVVPDYRLAPEHPWPAAIDDAEAVWRALTADGTACSLAGDSAGAGLAMSLVHRLRDTGAPMPRTMALISPWVDLRLQSDSFTTHAARDPMLNTAWAVMARDAYIGDGDPADPRWSTLLGDQHGLPPTLIHVGSEEILLDDAQDLAAELHAAGVAVEIHTFDGLWHDFHLNAGVLPRAREAVEAIGRFVLQEH